MTDSKVLFIPQLTELCGSTGKGGPQWGAATEDLNLTVLSWKLGQGVAEHTNNELDVLWIGLEGSAEVVVDGEIYQLEQGGTIVIPRGTSRSLESTSERCSYISIHRRRAGLTIKSRL